MGDEATRTAMKGRGQLAAGILVVCVAVAAGTILQRGVGANAFAAGPPATAPSGAWFCPHGGGNGWKDTLEVANPGDRPVRVRVTRVSDGPQGSPREYIVDPGAEVLVAGRNDSRASSSVVEYFGGWVAAAWVSKAGGEDSGVAAEPCSPTGGRTWLLPDGSTELAEEPSAGRQRETLESWVIVMNPFAADAIFSLTLYTDRDPPVRAGAWTNVVLKPFRSRAFRLNDQRLGYATVSARVEASVGRVAASSLNVSATGGARSALGELAPVPANEVLPGGFDQGRTELVAMNPSSARGDVTGVVLGRSEPQPFGGPDAGPLDPESAQTFALTTDGPSGLEVAVPSGMAVVRRTFGRATDQAVTVPGAPARAWVVLPAVGGRPSHAGIVVANPGASPVEIRLSYLLSGTEAAPRPITIRVPALRTVAVPSKFVQERPLGAILAVASDGGFVPVAASYSLGRDGYAGYAVSRGVPIPARWIPPPP